MSGATVWDPATTVVPLPGTTNLRDLGGAPAGDRVVPAHRLYRSEALVRPNTPARAAVWDPTYQADYDGLGVRTVVDLRSRTEAQRAPSAWPVATGARYLPVPVGEGAEGETDAVAGIRDGRTTRFTVDDLARFYIGTLERCAEHLGEAVRPLTRLDDAPVLVHCAAGKDRTGLVIALTLETLGVTREDVVADYALTGVLRPNRVEAYREMLEEVGVEPVDVAPLFDAPATAMAEALEHLDHRYGGPIEYLRRACGLRSDDIDALRANLLVRTS